MYWYHTIRFKMWTIYINLTKVDCMILTSRVHYPLWCSEPDAEERNADMAEASEDFEAYLALFTHVQHPWTFLKFSEFNGWTLTTTSFHPECLHPPSSCLTKEASCWGTSFKKQLRIFFFFFQRQRHWQILRHFQEWKQCISCFKDRVNSRWANNRQYC